MNRDAKPRRTSRRVARLPTDSQGLRLFNPDRPTIRAYLPEPPEPPFRLRFFDPARLRTEPIPEPEFLADQPAAPTQQSWSLSHVSFHRLLQVHVWTAAEWASLAEVPIDAREQADGSRIALRIA